MLWILSLDGGGIRGVIEARILAHVEAALKAPISSRFDLVAGTSTGGILACCIGIDMPMAMAETIYSVNGPNIFRKRRFFKTGLLIPKFPPAQVEDVLKKYFGTKSLADCTVDVLVTTFDHVEQKSVMMTSREPRRGDLTANVALWEACRRTSSAPVYFESQARQFHDGGVFANNPSLCAIAEAIAKGTALEDIQVLSIGSGAHPPGHMRLGREGAAGVLPHLTEIFMGSGGDAIDYICRCLIGDRYVRIQTDLGDVSPAMDDASPAHVAALLGCAEQTIAKWGKGPARFQ